MNTRRAISTLPWLCASIVLIIYLPVLQLGYVWDDWQLFINNPVLRLPELVWKGILQPILPGTTYFRPLPLGSFALEFAAYGVEPTLSHALNLALHASNTLLVGLIAAYLTENGNFNTRAWRILAASLIYGLHPALIEPVTWVSGRFDLMVTFFVLLGIWAYLNLHGWRRDLFVTICFLLAALSKEMAATFPALLFLFYLGRQELDVGWRLLLKNIFRSDEWRLYALLVATGILILVIRQSLYGQWAHEDLVVKAVIKDPIHHLAFIGQTLIFYLKMSLWPISDLNPQHPFNPADLTYIARWYGVLAVFAGILAVVILIKNRGWSALMLAGWAIALLPVLNIIPLTTGGNIGHERFLTLPLVFLALSVSLLKLPALSPAMSRTLPATLGILSMAFLFISVANIRVTIPLWENELTLWTWAYTRHPDTPFIQASYVGAAIHYGDFTRAEAALERAGENIDYRLKTAKAIFLLKKDRPADAIAQFEDALKEAQPPHELLLSSGIKLEDAKIERMNATLWFYRSAYTGLAGAYLDTAQYEQALDKVKIALFYAPYYPSAWMIKAFAYYGIGQWDEGEKTFAQAQHYFIPLAGKQAQEIRTKFLTQLCGEPSAPHDVCENFRKEKIELPSGK